MNERNFLDGALSLPHRPGLLCFLGSMALAPIVVFAGLGTVAVVVGGGVTLALAAPGRQAALAYLARPLPLSFLAILFWGFVSTLWSIDPGRSLVLVLRQGLLFAAGLTLVAGFAEMPRPERVLALRGLIAGLALMLALLAFEFASDGAITHAIRRLLGPGHAEMNDRRLLGRAIMQFAILIWPALLAMDSLFGRRAALVAAIPVAALLWFAPIDAARLVLLLSAATFAVVYAGRQLALRALFAAAALLVVASPLIASHLPAPADLQALGEDLPLSWSHRLAIWHYAAARIAEHPLLGWGFDAGPVLIKAAPDWVALVVDPHSLSLQVWLELGVPGILLMLVFGLVLYRRLSARIADRTAVAAIAAALVGYLTFGHLSLGAWQFWWLADAWLLAAGLAAVMPLRAVAYLPLPATSCASRVK